jgi:hypothetical protein
MSNHANRTWLEGYDVGYGIEMDRVGFLDRWRLHWSGLGKGGVFW